MSAFHFTNYENSPAAEIINIKSGINYVYIVKLKANNSLNPCCFINYSSRAD